MLKKNQTLLTWSRTDYSNQRFSGEQKEWGLFIKKEIVEPAPFPAGIASSQSPRFAREVFG